MLSVITANPQNIETIPSMAKSRNVSPSFFTNHPSFQFSLCNSLFCLPTFAYRRAPQNPVLPLKLRSYYRPLAQLQAWPTCLSRTANSRSSPLLRCRPDHRGCAGGRRGGADRGAVVRRPPRGALRQGLWLCMGQY